MVVPSALESVMLIVVPSELDDVYPERVSEFEPLSERVMLAYVVADISIVSLNLRVNIFVDST